MLLLPWLRMPVLRMRFALWYVYELLVLLLAFQQALQVAADAVSAAVSNGVFDGVNLAVRQGRDLAVCVPDARVSTSAWAPSVARTERGKN